MTTGAARGLFIYRRIFLTMMCISILIFVTSPLSIFYNIKQYDSEGVLEFNWTGESFFGLLLKQHLPPFVVVCLNQVLVLLIDLISKLEVYETHSLYQRAIYFKTVIYICLNMMVIPTLTLSQGKEFTSLYDFMSNHKEMSLT
jgi:hypothetical protein